jgi:hypothetical protein
LSSLVVMFIMISSTLTAQPTASKQWKKINEGSWEFAKQRDGVTPIKPYMVNNFVIFPAIPEKGKNTMEINGTQKTTPICISIGDSLITVNTDWSGDVVFPNDLFKMNDSTYFVTNGPDVYTCDIDFYSKTIKTSYTKLITGEKNIKGTDGFLYSEEFKAFYCDGNNNYFVSSRYAGNWLYICDKEGKVINKTIQINKNGSANIANISSILEWENQLYIGYDFAGGIPDGSGLAVVDTTTGNVAKITGEKWSNNLDGCKIQIIDGHFYLTSAPGTYNFRWSLFEYKNGSWETLIVGAIIPEMRYGKLNVLVYGKDLAIGYGHYPNGDTINRANGAEYFEFFPSTGRVGNLIPEDPRLNIQFSEEYKTEYYQRHGYMPFVNFIYEIGNKVIGFGPSVIAELVDKNTSVNTVSKLIKLSVYPNPTTGIVHISGNENPENYTVTDMTGKTVMSGTTMETIDLTSLTPGMYIILTPGKFARITKE